MDSVRYVLAVLMLISVPPALLFWLIVHPFIHIWRRLGPTRTYTVLAVLYVVCMVGLYQLRRPLLAVEFGTDYRLIGLGALILAASLVLAWQRKKQLTARILVGVPELSPQGHPQKLLTEGIYAHIRHPRYLEGMVGMLAYALIINYLAVYVLYIVSLCAIFLIVNLEEKELRERFGGQYEDYCRRVPRFLPRWSKNQKKQDLEVA